MEMKADPQSQAWARSAKDVLIITNESIAETLLTANQLAKSQGHPLFCLPPQTRLDAATMKKLIEDAYRNMTSLQNDKNKMTVSEIAWLAVSQHYPCNKPQISTSNAANLPQLMLHEQG